MRQSKRLRDYRKSPMPVMEQFGASVLPSLAGRPVGALCMADFGRLFPVDKVHVIKSQPIQFCRSELSGTLVTL